MTVYSAQRSHASTQYAGAVVMRYARDIVHQSPGPITTNAVREALRQRIAWADHRHVWLSLWQLAWDGRHGVRELAHDVWEATRG